MLGSASVPMVSVFSRPDLPCVPAVVNSTILGIGLERVHNELAVDPSLSVGLEDHGATFLLPLPRDGPLGLKGETITLSSLKNRSRRLLGEFAWNKRVSFC